MLKNNWLTYCNLGKLVYHVAIWANLLVSCIQDNVIDAKHMAIVTQTHRNLGKLVS